MDINDLFDRMDETFREYQKEISHGESVSIARLPLDWNRKKKLKKRRKLPTEKEVKENLPNGSDWLAFEFKVGFTQLVNYKKIQPILVTERDNSIGAASSIKLLT